MTLWWLYWVLSYFSPIMLIYLLPLYGMVDYIYSQSSWLYRNISIYAIHISNGWQDLVKCHNISAVDNSTKHIYMYVPYSYHIYSQGLLDIHCLDHNSFFLYILVWLNFAPTWIMTNLTLYPISYPSHLHCCRYVTFLLCWWNLCETVIIRHPQLPTISKHCVPDLCNVMEPIW